MSKIERSEIAYLMKEHEEFLKGFYVIKRCKIFDPKNEEVLRLKTSLPTPTTQ